MPAFLQNNDLNAELNIINGEKVHNYELKNLSGVVVGVTNFGATLTKIAVPDRDGQFADVALGYDSIQDYLMDDHYMGGIVGRYANRISGGLVEIEGKKYQLTVNDRGFHHHGGEQGFNKKVWKTLQHNSSSVTMSYLSPDQEEGFPGDLTIIVKYTLTDDNELVAEIEAVTSKATVLNITNHTYFNLAGHNSGNILSHELQLPFSRYLPVNEQQLVTGELRDVKNSVFDFRKGKPVGQDILELYDQLLISKGYDHTWVIKQANTPDLALAAVLTDKLSGRVLTVYTTEPAIHVYSANFLDNVKGKNGAIYQQRSGICLETQHYPDSPNHKSFPSTLLRPGEVFKTKTVYRFSTCKR